MRKKREEEIQRAIREMMQENLIRLVFQGEGERQERYHQHRHMFLYLEIRDTSPKIRHLYDLSDPVFLGRSDTKNQICIRDQTVSKYQGHIRAESGKVYYADEADAGNPAVIRRGLWSVKLRPGERVCLQTGDRLIVGAVKIKLWLFAGEHCV